MPWVFWRYMSDRELWDIAAYLKHGLKPVSNEIPTSDAPEDKWASRYSVDSIGTHVLPPFPAAREELRAPEKRAQVLRGRELVASRACSGCHGGTPPSAGRGATGLHPGQENWLVGMTSPEQEFRIGDCEDPESDGCFVTRPRNLTPHNTTGIGRFTERQIFNALRFGLRPGETPDVEITSAVPGEGNFPEHPKYLAPPMPWPSWRHMPDQDLWDIAAYLKHGVKPVENKVEDSEGPPDFWAGLVKEFVRPLPAAEFPTDNEVAPDG
jgi:mono/diheme cytochrome c family protein